MRPSRRGFYRQIERGGDRPLFERSRGPHDADFASWGGIVRELGHALEKPSEDLSGERSRERNEIPDRV